MKLNENFIVYSDEKDSVGTVLVSTGNTGFAGMVKCSPTAAFIVNCLSEDVTEEQIAERLREQFYDEGNEIESDVRRVIAQLREIGAVD